MEARATEARRQAEERRANEEAARRQAEEQRARQETERREAAERAREAEARVRAAQAAAARQQAAAQPPGPAPRPAVAEGPIRAGLYSSGTGYEVDVKLVGDSLVLTERAYNRTSEYRPTAPGSRVYGYRNPNTGTHFALTVQDNTTLVASRFSGSGEVLPNGTPLRFAGGAAEAQPVSEVHLRCDGRAGPALPSPGADGPLQRAGLVLLRHGRHGAGAWPERGPGPPGGDGVEVDRHHGSFALRRGDHRLAVEKLALTRDGRLPARGKTRCVRERLRRPRLESRLIVPA